MLRVDSAIARLGAASTRNKLEAFMPWPVQEEVIATPENVAALLRGGSQKRKP